MESRTAVVVAELLQVHELVKKLDAQLNLSQLELCRMLTSKIIFTVEKAICAAKACCAGEAESVLSNGRGQQAETGHKTPKKYRIMVHKWTKQVRVSSEAGSEMPSDGHRWTKYGQKEIIGAKYPRVYYRCTHRKTRGCSALKQVQKSDDNPTVLDITYFRNHSCSSSPRCSASKALKKTLQVSCVSCGGLLRRGGIGMVLPVVLSRLCRRLFCMGKQKRGSGLDVAPGDSSRSSKYLVDAVPPAAAQPKISKRDSSSGSASSRYVDFSAEDPSKLPLKQQQALVPGSNAKSVNSAMQGDYCDDSVNPSSDSDSFEISARGEKTKVPLDGYVTNQPKVCTQDARQFANENPVPASPNLFPVSGQGLGDDNLLQNENSYSEAVQNKSLLPWNTGKANGSLDLSFDSGRRKDFITDGDVCLDFTEAAVRGKFFKWALVGRVIGRSLQFAWLEKQLEKKWEKAEGLSIRDLGNDCFFLQFASKEARDLVWLGGPWDVMGHPIGLDIWTPGFWPLQDAPMHAPLWIRLPGLPVEYWGAEIYLGSALLQATLSALTNSLL